MSKNDIKAITYKRKKYKNKSLIEEYVKENELNRVFNQKHIDQVWCGDITYAPCVDGTLYVSTYIDLGSRYDVSYDIRTNMKEDLVIDSLIETFSKSRIPKMIHTDRGSQYRSYKFKETEELYQREREREREGGGRRRRRRRKIQILFILQVF